MVSKKQKELIIAIGKHNENYHIAHETITASCPKGSKTPKDIQFKREAMNNRLSRAFNKFKEDVELFYEYYDVFAKDFKRTPEIYTPLRSIARRVRNQ